MDPDCDSHSPSLLDYFFLLMLVFVLQWLSLHWAILLCCCISCHWLSIKFTVGCPIYLYSLWLFSCWLGQSLWSFERCTFKLSASAASEFCEWDHVGIDVYIPHLKYQVKPHSSSWFSAVFSIVMVHRNHQSRTNKINLLNLE